MEVLHNMNYNETNISGTQYQRAAEIKIINPLNTELDKIITFVEQKVYVLDSKSIVEGAGILNVTFNPSEVITIIDPSTGEPTGNTVTHAEIYKILYSVYIQYAKLRDQTI